jgi:hypothetical protein
MRQSVVKKFILYFYKQWMVNPNLSTDIWNVYERGRIRTNNALEGYHNRLKGKLGVHSTFWKFLTKLQKEMAHNVIMLKGFMRGSFTIKSKSKKHSQVSKQVRNLNSLMHTAECDGVLNPDKVVTHIQNMRHILCQSNTDDASFNCRRQTNLSISDEDRDIYSIKSECPKVHDPLYYSFCPRRFSFSRHYDDDHPIFDDSLQLLSAYLARWEVMATQTGTVVPPLFENLATASPTIIESNADRDAIHALLSMSSPAATTPSVFPLAVSRYADIEEEKAAWAILDGGMKDPDNDYGKLMNCRRSSSARKRPKLKSTSQCAKRLRSTEVVPYRLLWMPAATSSCVDMSQTDEGAVLKADDSETDSDEEREVVQFLVNQTEWVSHSEQDLLEMRSAKLSKSDKMKASKAVSEPFDDTLVRKRLFNIEMTRKKCSSLLPNGWINDEVINFYFQLLQKRDNALYQCIGYPKAKNFFFNSYFMNKLLDVGVSDKYNYSQVRKWTKKINIFTREKCFIPVNISLSHWTLIVIFMSTKKVIYYDSLPTRPTAENTHTCSFIH